LGGLFSGVLLDYLGFQRNPIGQWFVRTLSGEGESIFEGIYALRHRARCTKGSMAEAYGWGKSFRAAIPWRIPPKHSQLWKPSLQTSVGFHLW